jgi:DNA-binding XRE family transcriptional regulator
MTPVEFVSLRKKLEKTQLQMAAILGVSLKAVHSYEQGWRTIPPHVERLMLFLLSCKTPGWRNKKQCWTVMNCATAQRKKCPVWEFGAGRICWMINGTHCQGKLQKDWKSKMAICHDCDVMKALICPER